MNCFLKSTHLLENSGHSKFVFILFLSLSALSVDSRVGLHRRPMFEIFFLPMTLKVIMSRTLKKSPCPGRGSNRGHFDLEAKHVAIKAGVYRKAVQV